MDTSRATAQAHQLIAMPKILLPVLPTAILATQLPQVSDVQPWRNSIRLRSTTHECLSSGSGESVAMRRRIYLGERSTGNPGKPIGKPMETVMVLYGCIWFYWFLYDPQ